MGKHNQSLWVMSSYVLGRCMQRYNSGEFEDVDSAMKVNVGKTILSNQMFFGDNLTGVAKELASFHPKKNWLP